MKIFRIRGGEPGEEKVVVETDAFSDVVLDEPEPLDVVKAEQPFKPQTVEATIARRQEWVRATLAILFVVLLCVIVLYAFHRTENWKQTVELLDRVLPAVTGLLGSVVGFYFATRNGK